MTENETPTRWGSGVRTSAPTLSRIEFEFSGQALPAEFELNTEFGLSVHRFSLLEIGIEFSVSIVEVPELQLAAAYRMVFRLDPEFPEAKDPEKAFKQVAARLAPLAMYPFLREVLASTALKAGLPQVVLPIQNVGDLFEAESIEVPPSPTEEEAIAPEA